MSRYIPGNQKHLTLDDRRYIERSLNQGLSFKEITKYLCKDPATISKEVRAHRLSDWYHKGSFYNAHNFCIYRCRCRKTNVCRKIILCDVKCASCPACNQTCPDFVRERCGRLDKVPCQIITNHPGLDMSVRTLYAYLDVGLFTARNIDLKRKVKFKPRKCHNTQIKDRTVFHGKMYTDFQALSSDHWDMDTVHSSNESKKVLLTFFLKREKLFPAFLMNRCTKGAVRAVFDRLEKKLGTYDSCALFIPS